MADFARISQQSSFDQSPVNWMRGEEACQNSPEAQNCLMQKPQLCPRHRLRMKHWSADQMITETLNMISWSAPTWWSVDRVQVVAQLTRWLLEVRARTWLFSLSFLFSISLTFLDTTYDFVWYWFVLYCIEFSVCQCVVFNGIACYCIVLHCFLWCCKVMHGIAWFCMVLICIILYWIQCISVRSV